jgi:3-oxoacyl-[acyl-carrier protein] reductase
MVEPRNFLIVGGSSGIGLATALKLKEKSNNVFVASRRIINEPGIQSVRFDALSDSLDASALPPSLDGLAYCPGSINLKPFHRLTDQEFIDDFLLNALGAVRVVRSVLPLLKNANQASIVFFSTVAVEQGMPFHASISMAKGALEGLTKSLAAELSPKIRVNCIAPSLTNTPLATRLLATDEKKQASAERHPLKKVGEATDIASLASFLLGNESSWITGQIIHIDGGMSTLRPM